MALHNKPGGDEEQERQSLGDGENGPPDRLTSIHARIHWADTADTTELENELDRITINRFLDTLVEVALAVARRQEPVID